MGKCKTKTIQADLGIFTHIMAYSRIFRLSRHIQAHSGIFRNYSGIFWTLCNPGIFRTLLYWASWHTSKPEYVRGIFRTLVHPKLWHIQNQKNVENPELFRIGDILRTLSSIYDGALWETANSYNYFRKLWLFLQYQPLMSSNSWNKYNFLMQV